MYLDYYLGKSILTFLVCQGCRDQEASPIGDIFNFASKKANNKTTFQMWLWWQKDYYIIEILRKNKTGSEELTLIQ